MTASTSFDLLDERIKHFIWAQRWEELREVQELAIPLIIEGSKDVVIAAQTAAGKTEAAFLPALTRLRQTGSGGLIVYVSPLKALINDQFGRLDKLCEDLEVPVWPWHGDVSGSAKHRFLRRPSGVLLITPESLEATLCNRGSSVGTIFNAVQCFVIDELHAFIGTERGKQLQSLLHRIERAIGRRVVRIGLSATLGDMGLAAEYMRPGGGDQVALVVAPSGGSGLKMLVKGYVEPAVLTAAGFRQASEGEDVPDEEDEPEPQAPAHVALHLYKALRGTNNLVFPNSRREVERYTKLLNDLCERAQTPKEFWPHHGSLSKELRSETEAALKQRDVPASAVCTNTLELGIDIGAVKSVAQVGSPFSVASLRQRLGRSGRRAGESKILRGYVIEKELSVQSKLFDALRIDTVQLAAMIELLLDDWFEPPPKSGLHLSTLVQQLLSLIAQRGGVTAQESYAELCGRGAPFFGLSSADYVAFLRHLAQKELVMQDASGDLLHGRVGERLVNHYEFYAAFSAEEEYRLLAGGRLLGAVPVSCRLLNVGQRLLFAGKTWTVQAVEEEQRAIYVAHSRGRGATLSGSGGGSIHTMVRRKMRALLASDGPLLFLDPAAQRFLDEGRATYRSLRLDEAWYVDCGTHVMLMTWLGDAGNEALACVLISLGYSAWSDEVAVVVNVSGSLITEVVSSLRAYAVGELPPVHELLENAKNLAREKWDWALPPDLLRRGYASLHLDLDEAMGWVRKAISVHDSTTADA